MDLRILLRALIKRGVTPISSEDANTEAAGKTARRFTRAISLSKRTRPLPHRTWRTPGSVEGSAFPLKGKFGSKGSHPRGEAPPNGGAF